jgi:DNA polymerase V
MRSVSADDDSPTVLDLRVSRQTTGWPSPSEDYAEASLDVRELLVRHPAATFFMRAEGDAMRGAGIRPGDILVVDRALSPLLGSVVVAVVHGELLVRRYWPGPFATYLLAAHSDHPPIRVPAESECHVWGVVTFAIHPYTPPSATPCTPPCTPRG